MKALTPDQLAKLPKWAQAHIRTLEMKNSQAMRMVADLKEARHAKYSGAVYSDRYLDGQILLNEKYPIVFKFGESSRLFLRVLLEGDHININGGDCISVEPRSGNAVNIRVIK